MEEEVQRHWPSELRRLRQLEEENRKLKQLVADLSLDKAMLQAVLAKKSEDLRIAASRSFSLPWIAHFGQAVSI